MSIPAYTEGYPPDGFSLGNTKAVIRDNLDGTFLTLGVDHVNNNGEPLANPAGYHTVIHQVTQTSVDTVPDVNQVFSGVPGLLQVNATITSAIPSNGDTQLYTLTGAGGLSQLTGYLAPAADYSRGYQWLGGILMMWGFKASPGGNGAGTTPVLFAPDLPDFPNFVYNAQVTIATNAQNNSVVSVGNLSTTGFTIRFNLIGDGVDGFYWTVIGR